MSEKRQITHKIQHTPQYTPPQMFPTYVGVCLLTILK